ncbi:PepSY domain-containing protein [uncultured Tateyamaria sp.]|uniref:PepSY domain-containing protein n=1 Tax=uncultured Tateyamaria sp. TaxID=455651 RepID=UPI00260AAC6A|nr:PepSY domain-containing protein [uncultured Tateyamaria sp.]
MTNLTKPAILAALIVPGIAIAGADVGQTLGTSEADVRSALTAMGYVVQEIEIEGEEIEAEVTLEGVAYEIEVAIDTGLVTEIELEDDEDDNDS